ncbi:DUF4167 domain-containing protein [Sphingomonas sp. MAH-20]|uniref:DUF4167 domain-containing protein n=1 Tax=Sphingomonas horti TaxID=2682842 RepID=A0A6I4J3M4_9SPHN|nr:MULTISPECIES: DUF4167 domain-containing protein [Sphingomonas]MBA2918903.1 DUF4167 domain-containing protein [Sphingomonas sp. CGMCC 1.13658]MVO78936.1 DUF4167 domain-containing protein [Sphingomonas horti]
MIDNRQGGRRRGRGGQRPQGNPGRPGGGGGNRIDNRARGNAQQLHEKYKNLARDAQMAGDRVTTEYYLQFADHYFRVLSESRARFEEQRPQRSGSDDEFEGEDGGDEFEARDNNQRRERNDRDRGDRNGFRRDDERRDRQPAQAAEAAGDGSEASETRSGDEEGQRRNRRPRRQREDSEPVEAFDVDRLPPSIAADTGAAEEQPAPRRRTRRPRPEGANDTVEVPPAA